MRRKVFLLLAALMAVVAVNADDKWPVTLTTADGLPGSQPLFDNTIAKNIYSYKSPLFTFDEATDKLRLTVCRTTATEMPKASYLGRASRGPGLPYFSIAELRVYDANGVSVPFELSSNSVASNSSLNVLCDGDSMTYFQSTSGKGSFDGNYHYLELKFDEPISSFSLFWSSHPISNSNMPTYVGLTPGTDYMPCPEQKMTVEQVTAMDALEDKSALFVLKGSSPEWHYSSYDRTYPGGGFFEAPCLAMSAPSPLGLFSLIPVDGKENTYNVKYLNLNNYIANPASVSPAEVSWTPEKKEAAEVTFELLEDGTFELKIMDKNLLLVQNGYMRMATAVRNSDGTITASDTPVGPNFTLYKANVSGAAFAPRLQAIVDDARERLALFGPTLNEVWDCIDADLLLAIENAEKCIANPSAAYSEVCDMEQQLRGAIVAYSIEYAYLTVDSLDKICEQLLNGDLEVSSASNWQKGTFPEDMEQRLQYYLTGICDVFTIPTHGVLDLEAMISEIDAAIASLDATLQAFWASRIQYVEELPFMVGAPADKLPGKLASYGGYEWESPIYYLSEPCSSFRFTVVMTDGPTRYLGYDVPSISEFELYDNLGNKIPLTEDMITMNSLTTFGGSSLKSLVDGKETTFARGAFDASRADVYGYADDPQYFYIDVQLTEPINSFRYAQKGYKQGEENPVQFIFGEYGVKVAPDSVAFAEKYGATEIEKISDVSQITDDGIYAIFGMDDCDKVNCHAGDGGFYADTKKLSSIFNTQCAYTLKSAGDGKYYIRSLSSGAYWGRDEYTFAKKNFRSEASKITIAPRSVGNFTGSFAIYEADDQGEFPYLVFEDWSGELGLNPLASLEECEFDGQCDWYIYRVNVDSCNLLALDASIAMAKELGITVSNDPGCYAGMSAFVQAIAEAEAVAAAADDEAAATMAARLDEAIEAAASAQTNPVVEGVYVIENAMERFAVISGAKKAISCAKDEKNPDIYIYRWEDTPMNAQAMDSAFCFEFISAAGSDVVAEWLSFGYISGEDVGNSFYIRNMATGLYVAGAEAMNAPLATSEAPLQPFMVKYCGNASFKIYDPSAANKNIYAYNHQDGAGEVGYVVYDVTEGGAALWNLRLLRANSTSIDAPVVDGDEVVSVAYYTLSGTALAAPAKGVNVVRYVYRNGAVKSSKIYVK